MALKTVQAVSIYGGVISRLDLKTSCKMSKADAFVLIVIVASMTFRKRRKYSLIDFQFKK